MSTIGTLIQEWRIKPCLQIERFKSLRTAGETIILKRKISEDHGINQVTQNIISWADPGLGSVNQDVMVLIHQRRFCEHDDNGSIINLTVQSIPKIGDMAKHLQDAN